MVVIVNESTVNKNPKMLKYKNLAAFALGKAPSLTDVVDKDGKPVVNYNYVNFLPDKDTINAVINGDMSAKKVIKKAIKALRNPSTENQAIGMTVVHLVHMITDEYRTKNQIKEAVEKMFEGTKVKSVNTMNCEGKNRRRGMVVGKTAKTKKAIVALTADSKEIEIFAGL